MAKKKSKPTKTTKPTKAVREEKKPKRPARVKPARRATGPKAPERIEAPKPAEAPEAEAAPEVVGVDRIPPEVAYAARVPPPPPERPRPFSRRGIFFDVENTSRTSDVERMLEQLAIDRHALSTELVASGNWRVIGSETGRLLARNGAHLVHSAPTIGVRDWSDLRIAVAAGMWLASARAGDKVDVVSDDKAFDVIGDVAASLGVEFVRHSYRAAGRAAKAQAQPAAPKAERPSRRRRGGGRRAETAEAVAPVAAPEPVPAPMPPAPEKASAGAPHDQLIEVIHELLRESPSGVMLDVVARRLKSLGFERPQNSPRLVTRLRGMKELSVSQRGLIRAKEAGPTGEESTQAETEGTTPEGQLEGRRRRRRRGGRSRGGKQETPVPEGEPAS